MLDAVLPPFPGFRPEAFAFLRDLRANNDRAWFKPRKAVYDDELRWPMECLVAQLGRELPARGVPLRGLPERALFRLYRDTRFSKNKDPYKTHVAAYLSRTGSRDDDGGLYVHVAPENVFVGGGFWSPDPVLLRRWRARIAARPDEFLGLVDQLADAGLTMKRQDPLKRLPRGYEAHADAPEAEWLRARGLFAERPFTEADAATPAFAERCAETAVALQPFHAWGWGLLDG